MRIQPLLPYAIGSMMMMSASESRANLPVAPQSFQSTISNAERAKRKKAKKAARRSRRVNRPS